MLRAWLLHSLAEDALSAERAEHPSVVRSWATSHLPGKNENTPVGGWRAEWISPPQLFFPDVTAMVSTIRRENWSLSQLCLRWQGVPADAEAGWGRGRKLLNSYAWWQEMVGLEWRSIRDGGMGKVKSRELKLSQRTWWGCRWQSLVTRCRKL